MGKFRKKPVVIEAFTWNEFIDYGVQACQLEGSFGPDGVTPWSFKFREHPITHENDECYIIPTLEGNHMMTPADMLIVGIKGEIYPCKIDIFNETYEPAEENCPDHKTLGNTTVDQAKDNVKDIRFWGDGDLFKLISKAHSQSEGWMKSTKAMEVEGVGCVVQVTTQQGDHVAEAVTFVPGVKIVEEKQGWDENDKPKVVSRKLMPISML